MRELHGEDVAGTRNSYGPLDPKRVKASLLEAAGCRSAKPMYEDASDGTPRMIGYVVSTGRNSFPMWVRLHWREPWTGALR